MAATIGKISESLKNLLQAQMVPTTKVTLISPADTSASTVRMNLFLYRVVANSFLNNQDWLPKPGTTNQLVFPPLSINLCYLLTAFAPLDVETGLSEAQGVMGEAMRVLYENAVVPQAFLEPGLKQGEVKVTFEPMNLEDLSKIWLSMNKEFRLSAAYEVSYAQIPAKREQPIPTRVKETRSNVVAPARFPEVFGMSPASGLVNTDVQFIGENLRGWKATVRIGGQFAARDREIFNDTTFSVKTPAALIPGLYAVEVNVAEMARFQGSFQVMA